MDLRTRFGLPEQELDPDAAIVVIEPGTRGPIGVVVDGVLDVVALPQAAVVPVDPLSGNDHVVDALGHDGDRLIPILAVDRLVMGTEDLVMPEEFE